MLNQFSMCMAPTISHTIRTMANYTLVQVSKLGAQKLRFPWQRKLIPVTHTVQQYFLNLISKTLKIICGGTCFGVGIWTRCLLVSFAKYGLNLQNKVLISENKKSVPPLSEWYLSPDKKEQMCPVGVCRKLSAVGMDSIWACNRIDRGWYFRPQLFFHQLIHR